MKYTLNDAFQFGREGLKGRAYCSKENFANASAAYFEVSWRHGKVKTTHSDRIYLILDWVWEFEIGWTKVQVSKTDVVIVPKNTVYDYRAKEWTLKLFLVHAPAFDSDAEVKIE